MAKIYSETSEFSTPLSTSNHKDTFGERVYFILEQEGRSQQWLAEQLNIPKQTLSYLLNQAKKPKFTSEIADLLNINPIWLKTGKGNIKINYLQHEEINKITLQDLSQFDWQNIYNIETVTTIICGSHIDKKSFALRVDNSIVNAAFKDGTILIFSLKIPKNEDYILAEVMDNSSAVYIVGVYEANGSNEYLKSINHPTSKPIESFKKLGVLVEAHQTF